MLGRCKTWRSQSKGISFRQQKKKEDNLVTLAAKEIEMLKIQLNLPMRITYRNYSCRLQTPPILHLRQRFPACVMFTRAPVNFTPVLVNLCFQIGGEGMSPHRQDWEKPPLGHWKSRWRIFVYSKLAETTFIPIFTFFFFWSKDSGNNSGFKATLLRKMQPIFRVLIIL